MKTLVEKVDEKVSIQIEAEEGDSPEDIAYALVQMTEIIKGEKEETD